jgi:hypothetical protein
MVEDNGERLGLPALAIPLVVFREQSALAGDGGAVVAGGNELTQAELIEVRREILEEVALEWVVAVAVDDFAAERVGVELQVGLDLFLDVDVLSVELVLLGFLRVCQRAVRNNCDSAQKNTPKSVNVPRNSFPLRSAASSDPAWTGRWSRSGGHELASEGKATQV